MIVPTWHAQLRWLQRVDPTERYPAAAIRRAVESNLETSQVDAQQRLRDERHNVDLVVRRKEGISTVVTVLNGDQR